MDEKTKSRVVVLIPAYKPDERLIELTRELRGKDLGERLLISNNMVRHDELDFLDDITLEQASAALGVPIYPVDADGFALCDAMFGILPEVHLPDRGSGSTDGAEYYKYNPHKEG